MSEALEGDISREFYAILEHLQMAEFLYFVAVFFCNKNCAIFGVVVASEFYACVCIVMYGGVCVCVCVCVKMFRGRIRKTPSSMFYSTAAIGNIGIPNKQTNPASL